MKVIIIAAVAVFMSLPAYATSADVTLIPGYQTDILEHGGGCRKSSPPGQCCHMDNSTGFVHCH